MSAYRPALAACALLSLAFGSGCDSAAPEAPRANLSGTWRATYAASMDSTGVTESGARFECSGTSSGEFVLTITDGAGPLSGSFVQFREDESVLAHPDLAVPSSSGAAVQSEGTLSGRFSDPSGVVLLSYPRLVTPLRLDVTLAGAELIADYEAYVGHRLQLDDSVVDCYVARPVTLTFTRALR